MKKPPLEHGVPCLLKSDVGLIPHNEFFETLQKEKGMPGRKTFKNYMANDSISWKGKVF